MSRFALTHLSDSVLDRALPDSFARESSCTADVLAHIAEFDTRKRYLPAGYPSMFAYCVGELRRSEDAVLKRITAARAARRFPAIFEAVADGRLHLSGVVLLAPHLTEETVGDLLAAASHRTKAEIERLLAERFPQPDVLAWVAAIPAPADPRPAGQQAPPVDEDLQLAPGRVEARHAPGQVGGHSRVSPLSSRSFSVQFTLSQRGYEQLRRAQELLSHQIPSGDIAAVFERALDALIPQLEKTRFAATERPRNGQPRSARSARVIPAQVMREVWKRDGGQCTFVSESGHRCPARRLVEFDHIQEVARGGEATVAGIRLRCRAHNQHGAECTFGPDLMRHKRLAAAERRTAAKERAAAARAHAAAEAEERDVVPWLRGLGFSVAEARRAAAVCEDIPNASLEERVRVALSSFGKRSTRVGRAGDGPETRAALAGLSQTVSATA